VQNAREEGGGGGGMHKDQVRKKPVAYGKEAVGVLEKEPKRKMRVLCDRASKKSWGKKRGTEGNGEKV